MLPLPPNNPIDQQFEQTVNPLSANIVWSAIAARWPGAVRSQSYTSVDMVADDFARWALLAERLKSQEMPPSRYRPAGGEAQQIIDWVAAVRAEEIKKAAGDQA